MNRCKICQETNVVDTVSHVKEKHPQEYKLFILQLIGDEVMMKCIYCDKLISNSKIDDHNKQEHYMSLEFSFLIGETYLEDLLLN